MAARPSLSFLLLTGNLAGQRLFFKWKSVDFDSLRGHVQPRWTQVGQRGSVFTFGRAWKCAVKEGGGMSVDLVGFQVSYVCTL